MAAFRLWGHGAAVLQDRPNIHRPAESIPAPLAPPKTLHDTTIEKLDSARHPNEGGDGGDGNAATGGGPGEMLDSKGDQARWDEHDVMLYLWGNSPAAKERHRKKQEESTQRMEQWRQGVPSI